MIGPAVAILTFHGILAATRLVEGPLPAWTGIAAAFATGYCVLSLIAGGRLRLSSSEILAFSVGLAIFITSLSALAVSIVGIPITRFIVVFIGLPLGVIAVLTRSPVRSWKVVANFARRWFDFSDYAPAEKVMAAILLVGIAVAFGAFISLAAVTYPDADSMGIAVTGPGGSPDVPASFVRGIPQTVEVHVLSNTTPGEAAYAVNIALVPANATGNEPFHPPPSTNPLVLDAFARHSEAGLVFAPQTNWVKPYTLVLDVEGTFWLQFELVLTDEVVVQAHLSVIVTSG